MTFLVSQAVLIFCAVGIVNSGTHGAATGEYFLHFILALLLLYVLPMRGVQSVRREVRENTLDLLRLTSLSSRRIIAGKWAALMLETLLFVLSILPYIIIPYFCGGVDLVGQLGLLGCLVIGSAVATSIAVGFSAVLNPLLICLLPLLLILQGIRLLPAAYIVPAGAHARFFPGPVFDQNWLWAVAFLCPLLSLLFLEFGAGRIAPAAENHATSKRILALATVLLGVLLGRTLHANLEAILMATSILVIWTTSLETVLPFPSVYRPFVRFGALGRLAGRFLYPGWPSGMWFTIAIVGLLSCGIKLHLRDAATLQLFRWLVLGLGFIYVPLFLKVIFHSKVPEGVLRNVIVGFSAVLFVSFTRLDADLFVASFGPVVLVVLALLTTISLRRWKLVAQFERQAGDFVGPLVTHIPHAS